MLSEVTRGELMRELFLTRPTTPDELHAWILLFLGVYIPRKRCCPDHIASFEVVEKCFFEDPDWLNLLVFASRGSGKTLNTSILDVLEMHFKRCGIVSIGAIQSQADKAGNYVSEFLSKPEWEGLVAEDKARYKALITGGSVQVIPCTMTACNSPHEPKVNIDEAELADPQAYEEAKSIPMTDWRGNRASLRIFSTRKFAFGNIQQEIDKADESGTKVVSYCYKEVAERCPDERSGTRLDSVWVNMEDLTWCTEDDYFRVPENSRDSYESFEVFDKCLECSLIPTCRGDLKNSSGWMPISDIINAFLRHSVEMWLAQWECRKPNPKGMIFKHFSEDRNVTDECDYDPKYPCYWTKDWGFTDPDVTLLIQLRGDTVCIVDELYLLEMDTNEIKNHLNEVWLPAYGRPTRIEVPPDRPNDAKVYRTRRKDVPKDVQYKVHMEGAPVLDGIDEVRKLIRPIDGSPTRLYVHSRCRNFIREMLMYHYRLDSGEEPTEVPDHDHSHGPDALRYFVWNVIRGFRPQYA